VTRIAGALLRLHRVERGMSRRDLADEAGVDESTVSKAENGHTGLSSFCNNIGAYVETLNLSTEDVTMLMSALWADALFAAIASAKPDAAGRGASRLRLLQMVWHHREARRWFNLLVFDAPPPWNVARLDARTLWREPTAWGPMPCLARHRDVQRRFDAVSARVPDIDETRAGPKVETPVEVLHESLFVRRARSKVNLLQGLVRDATPDALDFLQQGDASKPLVGDLLRVIAEVARHDAHGRALLLRRLPTFSPAALHPVDARYRARALYLLGEDKALCPFTKPGSSRVSESVLEYYRKRDPGESQEIHAVSSLSRRVAWALAEGAAPLASFHLTVIDALLDSDSAPGDSLVPAPLANYHTTEHLFQVAQHTLALHRAKGWAPHQCAHPDAPCAKVAADVSRSILATVNRAAKALGIKRFLMVPELPS
jgi:transcriptional regulator with XRE-family HTH domain